MALIISPTASAEVVAPPSPPIYFGTSARVDAMTLNGQAVTLVAVEPGAAVTVVSTAVDARAPSGALLNLPIGYAGAPSATGCMLYRTLGGNTTQTRTSNLTAPMTAGVYDVVGAAS